MSLDKEFKYFCNRIDYFRLHHAGEYVVIKNNNILGYYPSTIEAINETKKTEELGTFLVASCDDIPTATFHGPYFQVQYLKKPLTKEEVRYQTNNGEDYLEAIVPVTLYELIEEDLEGFLDIISVRAIGSVMLMDITYNVVDVSHDENRYILIKVSGDVSEFLGDEDVDEE